MRDADEWYTQAVSHIISHYSFFPAASSIPLFDDNNDVVVIVSQDGDSQERNENLFVLNAL